MKIGELARAASTQVETIRYYEREGLLPEAPRTEGNYRVYGEAHIERLSFIRRCRGLDMSLDEIRILLCCKDSPSGNCTRVNDLIDEHIGHVAVRIAELKNLERQLRALRDSCRETSESGQCGILAGLSAGSCQEHEPMECKIACMHRTHGMKHK